jgi:hypothetical protein
VAGAVGRRSEIANGRPSTAFIRHLPGRPGAPDLPRRDGLACPPHPGSGWKAKSRYSSIGRCPWSGRTRTQKCGGYPWDLYPDRCWFPCLRSVLHYRRPLKAGYPLAIGRSQTLRLQTSLQCSPERSGSARSGWTNSGSTIARCRSTSGGASHGPVPAPRFRRDDEGAPADALRWRIDSARSATENVRAWDPTA